MITNDVIPTKKAKIQYYDSYVQDLKYATAYYSNWIPQEYSSILTQGEAYDLLKNDEKIRETLNLLSLFASGEKARIETGRSIDPRSEKVYKTIAEKCLNNIERFNHARKSAVFQSHLFGLSVQEVTWECKRINGLPGLWEVPKKIKEIDKRRFRLERHMQDKTDRYWTMWREEDDAYVVLLDRNDYPNYLGPQMQDYLWCWYEYEELEPYYRGLSHVLFRMAYTKKNMLQYWHELAEFWSRPWAMIASNMEKGAFDDPNLGTGFSTLTERQTEIIEQVTKNTARHTLVYDRDSEEIQFHEGGSIGTNIMLQYIEYADSRIQKNILGEDLETHQGGSSFNMGTLKREAMDAVIVDARSTVEELHSNNLLGEVWWRNRKNLESMGVPIPDKGDVKVRYYIESEEIKEQYLSEGVSEDRKQRSRANV